MLYVGYFSWVGEKPEILTEYWPNGKFSCLVEADSVDEAGRKLWFLVDDMRTWASPFEGVVAVHLETIVEVEKLPEQGVLAYFEEVDDLNSVSITLYRASP